MYLKFFIFFVLTSLFFEVNQNKDISGSVIYSVSFDTSKEVIKKESKASNLFNLSVEKLKLLRYELQFSNHESIYKINKVLSSDNDANHSYRSAKRLAGDSEIYINNKTKKKLIKKNFLGDDFLIKDSINFNWKITSESKKIKNFNCYKATLKINDKLNKNGIDIVAWFAPDIPVSFGPKGYSGLPGLILELTENRLTYKCEDIGIKNQKGTKISQLEGGISMSSNDYEQYVLKKINEYNFEKN